LGKKWSSGTRVAPAAVFCTPVPRVHWVPLGAARLLSSRHPPLRQTAAVRAPGRPALPPSAASCSRAALAPPPAAPAPPALVPRAPPRLRLAQRPLALARPLRQPPPAPAAARARQLAHRPSRGRLPLLGPLAARSTRAAPLTSPGPASSRALHRALLPPASASGRPAPGPRPHRPCSCALAPASAARSTCCSGPWLLDPVPVSGGGVQRKGEQREEIRLEEGKRGFASAAAVIVLLP
jgi:hypothetical protein